MSVEDVIGVVSTVQVSRSISALLVCQAMTFDNLDYVVDPIAYNALNQEDPPTPLSIRQTSPIKPTPLKMIPHNREVMIM
jgi:hypothetical protein